MIVRSARFLLTRLFYLVMGLPITRYRKEVERLWGLSEADRAEELSQMLARNRPLNSAGVEVGGLEALKLSPSLSKKQLRAQKQNEHRKNEISRFGRHTAGTTGEPTQISLTRGELARMLGVREYCFQYYGLKLGQREARLWGRREAGIKSWLKNFAMNRRVFHPVGSGARDEVADLLLWKPDYIYGYASLLLEAASLIADMNIEFDPPKCVVCTAESILPAQKAYISQKFNAPVAEEYGSSEFDGIAFECEEGHRHLVNPWLIVEDNSNDDGCLITDISRQTQSFIRYELGDSFSVSSSACHNLGSSQIVDDLAGRTLDRFFYITPREKIHATVFPPIFEAYFIEYREVFGFTVVQVGFSKIKVFVDKLEQSSRHNLEVFISKYLVNELNLDVKVDVEIDLKGRVNAIGKRNYFVQKISDL